MLLSYPRNSPNVLYYRVGWNNPLPIVQAKGAASGKSELHHGNERRIVFPVGGHCRVIAPRQQLCGPPPIQQQPSNSPFHRSTMLPTPPILPFPISRILKLLYAQPNKHYTTPCPVISPSHNPVANYGLTESLDAWKHVDTSYDAKNKRWSAEKHRHQVAPMPLWRSRGPYHNYYN